jgi:hypothetical protein
MPSDETVRIRLTQNLPVDSKHGATKGREFDAVLAGNPRVYWWIQGDDGERVGVFFHEAEVIETESKE